MAYFECIIGGGGGGESDVNLIVTCSPNFAGKTITCTNGTDTFTQTCPSTSPYTVTFENIAKGTWTISGVISGQTFSQSVVIGDYTAQLNDVPEGSTVTPVNDIQIWLNCANIWDKSYTTLDEVLADSTTLLALISSNNAVDYMVRSTDFAGQNYGLVPTMTSNTMPYGEAFGNANISGNECYRAFDGDDSTTWSMGASTNGYIGYTFTSPIPVKKVYILPNYSSGIRVKNFKIQASNDGFADDSHDLLVDVFPNQQGGMYYQLTNSDAYTSYRLYIIDNYTSNNAGVKILQFYGVPGIVDNQTAMSYIGNNDYCAETLLADATWLEAICNSEYFESVLNVKVPTMTSNTAPSGEAKGSPNNNGAYTVFDNNQGTFWQAGDNSGNNSWIQYHFPNSVKVSLCSIFMSNSSSASSYRNYIGDLLGSTDGSNFETIATNITVPHNTLIKTPIISTKKYNYFRLNTVQCNLYNTNNPRVVMIEAQFYGRA